MNKKKFILGICGRLGSGKSEILSILEKHGWFVIDADKVVHDLYEPGELGQRKIADFFGDEFLSKDGSVNRPKLRKIVFGDLKKLKILNALIHPLVFSEIGRIIDGVEDGKIAVEAVYFEEKYLGGLVDKLLLVERPQGAAAGDLLGVNIMPARVDGKVKNNSTLNALEKKVIIEVDKLIP